MTSMAASSSAPVVVLGMHRSGTSFLVRALNLGGLWLGDESGLATVEGRAMPGNPKGNYESQACIRINNEMLSRSGAAWFRPPANLTATAEDRQRMRTFCQALQASRPPDFPRFGFKDPRLVLTLDTWLPELPQPPLVIASFRHPAAVARSLGARDKIPEAIAWALWGHYNARLIGYLERLPHLLVRFDVERDALTEQALRACQLAGLRSDRGAVSSWFDSALVRSNGDANVEVSEPGFDDIWRKLLQLHQAQSCQRVSPRL